MIISWRTTAATSFFVSSLICGVNDGFCDEDSKLDAKQALERQLEQKRVDQQYEDQRLEDQRLEEKRLENAREQKRLNDRQWERSHGH